MNELRMCRHGLVEKYSSLPVKTVWSAGCANGPFDICVLSTDEGKDVKRRGKSQSFDLGLMSRHVLCALITRDHLVYRMLLRVYWRGN